MIILRRNSHLGFIGRCHMRILPTGFIKGENKAQDQSSCCTDQPVARYHYGRKLKSYVERGYAFSKAMA